MVFYECELCNFSSIYKNDFNRHLNTKKHLNNEKKYEDGNMKIPKRTQKGLKCKKKDSKRTQKDSKRTQNPVFCEKKNFECEFCKIKLKNRPIFIASFTKIL